MYSNHLDGLLKEKYGDELEKVNNVENRFEKKNEINHEDEIESKVKLLKGNKKEDLSLKEYLPFSEGYLLKYLFE